MSDTHELAPGVSAKERQIVELVDGFVEEDFIVEIQIQMLAVGLFNDELSKEGVYEEEVDLSLGKDEVAARIRRWYGAILLKIVQPVEQFRLVGILVHVDLLEVYHLVGEVLEKTPD